MFYFWVDSERKNYHFMCAAYVSVTTLDVNLKNVLYPRKSKGRKDGIWGFQSENQERG